MADLQGRKIFKVFNQDFIVDERYTVTKELGQGAYGIVWYAPGSHPPSPICAPGFIRAA
jgi:mitogen-activated protein kinase 7